MSRWIDADALRSNINTTFWAEVGKIIDSAPSIDIVRCGECKLGGTEDCPMDEIYSENFCSYGERKESE